MIYSRYSTASSTLLLLYSISYIQYNSSFACNVAWISAISHPALDISIGYWKADIRLPLIITEEYFINTEASMAFNHHNCVQQIGSSKDAAILGKEDKFFVQI